MERHLREKEELYTYISQKLGGKFPPHPDDVKELLEHERSVLEEHADREAFNRGLIKGGTILTVAGVGAGILTASVLPMVIPAALLFGAAIKKARDWNRTIERIETKRYVNSLPEKYEHLARYAIYAIPVIEHVDNPQFIVRRIREGLRGEALVEAIAQEIKDEKVREAYREVMKRKLPRIYIRRGATWIRPSEMVSLAREIEEELKAVLSSQESESSAS